MVTKQFVYRNNIDHMVIMMILSHVQHYPRRIITGTPQVGADATCIHAGREGIYAHAHYTVTESYYWLTDICLISFPCSAGR